MAEQELKSVITVIRAILQSAPSDGLLTRQLLNDYKNIEGSALPLKRLGYDTVDELIQKSGEFIQRRTSDGIKIIPKESADSAHINRLVQQQQKTRKKKRPATPQRPIRSPTANNQQRWRGSAYTDMYSRMPNRSVKKAVAAPASIPSLMSLRIDPPPVRSNRPYGQMAQQSNQNTNGSNIVNQQTVTPSATSTPFARKNTNQDMRPITKQSNIVDNAKFNYNSNKIDPPAPGVGTQTNGQAGNRILSRMGANNQISSMYSVAPQVTAPRTMSHGPVSPNDSSSNSYGSGVSRPKGKLSERLVSKKPLADQTIVISSDSDVVDFVAPTTTHNSQEVINTVSRNIVGHL